MPTPSRKQPVICQQKCRQLLLVAVEKPLPKAMKFVSLQRLIRLGEDGSWSSWPLLFFKQQGIPEHGISFDGVIPGINQPFVTAVSCRLCLPERRGAELGTSCSLFVYLQMSPRKEITQVGAALWESPRSAIQEGWDTQQGEGCSAS